MIFRLTHRIFEGIFILVMYFLLSIKSNKQFSAYYNYLFVVKQIKRKNKEIKMQQEILTKITRNFGTQEQTQDHSCKISCVLNTTISVYKY